MKKCNVNCGRGCHDFSSRAPQSPSIVDIEVVRQLLSTALVNSANRKLLCRQGEMTEDEAKAKDDYLVTWLTDTFSGGNPHFETGPENWNPHGLATSFREVIREMRVPMPDDMELSDDDEEFLRSCFELFVNQMGLAIDEYAGKGIPLVEAESFPPRVEHFIESWALILTGAPLSGPIN